MIQFFNVSSNWAGFNRFRQSLLSGFKTFLPLTEPVEDTFTRSGT